jgi:hypothetical protein
MMKYFVANLITLLIVAGFMILPIWAYLQVHWGIKAVLSIIALLVAAFFVERIASKWSNRIVGSLFREK